MEFKCEHCGEAEFETAQQLRGHQMKCRPQQEKRQERVPFGTQEQRFANVPQDDGYHYRSFNDNWHKEPGRVSRALAAGYEVYEHPQSGGTVGTNEDGSEIKCVLMRIPEELHKDDQALKEEGRQQLDNQIYQGKYQSTPGDGRYIPKDGIRMESKNTP